MGFTRALVRGIGDTFTEALTGRPKSAPIDVARARHQHRAYVEALARTGLEIVALPADDAFPDGCFVEDCAVVGDGRALITRPGAPSRRGETEAVRAALARSLPTVDTDAPATLDGGDCMRVGGRLFVGLSRRTNAAGVERLRQLFPEVIAVPLGDVLHLKCVCSPIGDDAILLADGTIPAEVFRGLDIVRVPRSEECAANAVVVGRSAIVAADHPRTARALEDRGLAVLAVDTSEIRKADGALTCLSVLH